MNKVIENCGIHHIALKVKDFDKSVKFYKDLGFSEIRTWGEDNSRAIMLDMGDGCILEMFAGGSDEECLGKFIHIALKANDIQKAYDIALNAGAVSQSEPNIVTLKSSPEPVTLNIAFVKGPDMEVIEFFKVVE